MKIVNVQKESLPETKLIGECYHKSDANQFGSYSAKWGEWFGNGWFNALSGNGGIEKTGDDYIGLIRTHEEQQEYWIGILMAPNDPVPEGYESLSLPSGDLAVCYVYGNDEKGELYSEQAWMLCAQAYTEHGWSMKDNAVFMERYNCPRFTTPDEQGNVILDICMFL